MDWLNYHHLRYFWVVAKEGTLAAAAVRLRVSQPSISEQIHELEETLGEKLFRREGRKNKLTDAGQIAFRYAEEIFALGQELTGAIKQRPGAKTLRFHVGIVDSMPKFVTNHILNPVFFMKESVHLICHEGKMGDLLAQLAAHRLDLVLADEPVSSSVNFRTFSHLLGQTDTTFCAERQLALRLKPNFPRSLHGAPALLPAETTPFRRTLENWFREHNIKPRVVAECEDLALMKVMASQGHGFMALPTMAAREAHGWFGFKVIGQARECAVRFHAISAERRIAHPAALLLTKQQMHDSELPPLSPALS